MFSLLQVIVDTSSILQNPSQALSSFKYWCYSPVDEVTAFYQTAPPNSVQNQIYRIKLNKDCELTQAHVMDINSRNYRLLKLNGYLIGTGTFCSILINFMATLDRQARFWVSGGFDGMNLGHLIRKSLSEKSKKFLVS